MDTLCHPKASETTSKPPSKFSPPVRRSLLNLDKISPDEIQQRLDQDIKTINFFIQLWSTPISVSTN